MSEPLTKEEVDAIRARLAAATPGPWLQFPRHGEIRMSFGGFENGAEAKGYSFWSHFRPADATFVCCAREDIERLLADADRASCTWCGHVGSKADVSEHILDCVKHPIGELARQLETAMAERDTWQMRAEEAEEVAGSRATTIETLREADTKNATIVKDMFAELQTTKAKLAVHETKAAKSQAELEDMKAKMSVARAAIEAREKAPGLKVWRATVSKETDIYVLAETEKDAQALVKEHAEDELKNVYDADFSSVQVVDPSQPPFGGGIPWSKEEDNLDEKEVDELLAEQLEREKEAEAQRIADANQLKLFPEGGANE